MTSDNGYHPSPFVLNNFTGSLLVQTICIVIAQNRSRHGLYSIQRVKTFRNPIHRYYIPLWFALNTPFISGSIQAEGSSPAVYCGHRIHNHQKMDQMPPALTFYWNWRHIVQTRAFLFYYMIRSMQFPDQQTEQSGSCAENIVDRLIKERSKYRYPLLHCWWQRRYCH